MTQTASAIYEFGHFQMAPSERLLLREGRSITLAPRIFETLRLLVQNYGRTLGKDKLMEMLWPDSYVEETNLAQNISVLRKALGEGKAGVKYIETIPKFGYRFIAPVKEFPPEQADSIIRGRTHTRIAVEENDDAGDEQSRINPRPPVLEFPPLRRRLETRYVKSGDANIAYQVVGEGPIDLVFVPGWVSHLDYFWEEPSFAHFLDRLSSFARLILFDKRGTGLSDRVPLNELPTLEQRMEDVRAVMNAAGSERAVLCGVSEGGPMCSLFAATYPERTSALVMIGSYARRLKDHDYPWGQTVEERGQLLREIIKDWGGPISLENMAPSRMHDERFQQWWSRYLRHGASPGAALALTRMNSEIDVRAILPDIHVSTLVLHRTDDRCLPVEAGRYLANHIPGAKFVELPGIDHLPFVGDQDAMLDEIKEFLTGHAQK